MSDSSDDDVEVYEDDSFASDDGEEEVLASTDDESSDEGEEDDALESGLQAKNDKFSRFKIERKKEDMASDIEDDEGEDDGMPSSQAWGANKQLFYDTDFVDKDYRSKFIKLYLFHLTNFYLFNPQVKKEKKRTCQSTKRKRP